MNLPHDGWPLNIVWLKGPFVQVTHQVVRQAIGCIYFLYKSQSDRLHAAGSWMNTTSDSSSYSFIHSFILFSAQLEYGHLVQENFHNETYLEGRKDWQ